MSTQATYLGLSSLLVVCLVFLKYFIEENIYKSRQNRMVNSYVAMTQPQACPFGQGSASYHLRAKSSPLLVFINKVLLDHITVSFVLHMEFFTLYIYF